MAAENGADPRDGAPGLFASMRPRRMAAENAVDAQAGRARRSSFNEAAANGRGKRRARG